MKINSPKEAETLSHIKRNDEVKELVPKVNVEKKGRQYDMKALCLILAYLMRLPELNESTRKDLEIILQKAPFYIEMMIQMAIVLAMEFKMGRSPKKVTAKNVLTIIDFSQNMIQALWKDDDHFLQVPHFN